ncbi:MAG: ectoine hydroxylase [Corticimicrobacter sp.]|uniref:ectoine hydroxylase n=1 Tax=Corticimicrobacter sp. TaxID=2678536 RepID=UPI0032DAC7B8
MILAATDPYASRTQRDSAIVMRQEPVVHGDGHYVDALAQAQLQTYEQDGFLVLDGLFENREAERWLGEIERLMHAPDIRVREEAIREKGSDAVRSIFRVHDLSPMLGRVMRDPRIADIARQLLGSEVYIHQSRANLKPGFKGKEFYWHSDFETWHIEDGMPAMRAVSCSILLTENTVCNGPLMLIPGSHRQFVSCVGRTPDAHYKDSLRRQEYGVPDPISLQLLAEQGGIRAVTGRPGTVVFFDCNTMHASAGNLSPWPRANLFTVYNSVENRLAAPRYGLAPRPEHVATREAFEPL